MDIRQIRVVKRKVRYPRLELKTGEPVLILPQNEFFESREVINRHQRWLKSKIDFIEQIRDKYKNKKIYHRSEQELIILINKFIEKFSNMLKTSPSRINFRYMKTKWGSCSKNRRICFNLDLKYLPPSLIEYVVFHEMVHLLIPNHSKNFWFKVKEKFAKASLYEERLYGYWFLLNRKQMGQTKDPALVE